MGYFVDGLWQEDVSRTKDGRFVRPPTSFRNFVTADGSPGPTGQEGFPAEAGRYHLYVSLACPWAHRTLIFRKLKKLDDVISVSIAQPLYGKTGWEFGTEPGATPDTVNGKSTLAEIYLLADAQYSGRVTVPVLWDKKRRIIVNNDYFNIRICLCQNTVYCPTGILCFIISRDYNADFIHLSLLSRMYSSKDFSQ